MSRRTEFKIVAEALILDPDNETLRIEFYQTVAGLIKYYNMQSKIRKDREALASGAKAAQSIIEEYGELTKDEQKKDCYDFTEAGGSSYGTIIDDIIKHKTKKRNKFYILHYMHRLSFAEIGEIFNVSKQAVQQGCFRAKNDPNLKEELISIAKKLKKKPA